MSKIKRGVKMTDDKKKAIFSEVVIMGKMSTEPKPKKEMPENFEDIFKDYFKGL